MLNYEKLNRVLTAYRQSINEKKPNGNGKTRWEDERYKWVAVKHFQDNWDIEAQDFGAMFKEATAKHVNLLASVHFYPLAMILEFAKANQEETRAMFRRLFEETVPVADRVVQFISEADHMKETYGNGNWNSHYQTLNAVSTYLWLRYPDRYYIYKYSDVKRAAEILESDFVPKTGIKVETLTGFQLFYDEIATYIANDRETTDLIHAALTQECYPDPQYRTLTVDVGFYISRYYSETDETKTEENTSTTDGNYWPAPEEYDPHITKEEWKKYLEEVEMPEFNGAGGMLKALMELGGEASCKKLSSVYGGKPTRYIGLAVNMGKRVKKYFNLLPCMDGDIERYFPVPFLGREVIEDGSEYYSYKIREELYQALKEIDLTDIDPYFQTENEEKTGYWWLNANPKIWSFSDIAVGAEQSYTLYNENGNKRRIFQNFLDAKAGDMVIGYESTPVKQIVALAKISKEQDGKAICFKKVEGLSVPIDYQVIKDCPELSEMEYLAQPQGSLFRLTKDEFDFIMDIIRESNPISLKEDSIVKYSKADFLNEVFMDGDSYDSLVSLLRNKKNLILQGAPGVGKTFAARKLAYSMMGEKDKSRIKFVQFHQNYSYEDFMMGYKPTETGFELKYGIFYQFCMLAANHPNKEFFFIIDEINRGNLSKIFGELLMLIEKDYRGEKTTLAYNGMPFAVPDNLYIIGMMNTADRSLAMIDYALRRRFGFFTMTPGFESDGFREYQKSIGSKMMDNLVNKVKELNDAISKDGSLGPGFCIGHSYFCGHKAEEGDYWLKEIVDYDILPTLNEYWFDDTEKVGRWTDRLSGVFNG